VIITCKAFLKIIITNNVYLLSNPNPYTNPASNFHAIVIKI
jgi:hypothetical protein